MFGAEVLEVVTTIVMVGVGDAVVSVVYLVDLVVYRVAEPKLQQASIIKRLVSF